MKSRFWNRIEKKITKQKALKTGGQLYSILPLNQCSMVSVSSKNKDGCERDEELIESMRPRSTDQRGRLSTVNLQSSLFWYNAFCIIRFNQYSMVIFFMKITMFLRERVDSGLLDQGILLEAEIKYNAAPHWYRLFWKKCSNKSLNRKRLNEIVYNLETSCTNSIFPFNQCSMVRFSSKNKDVCERDGELIESIRPGKATKRESLLPLTSS
jgi:hypothetical protein